MAVHPNLFLDQQGQQLLVISSLKLGTELGGSNMIGSWDVICISDISCDERERF